MYINGKTDDTSYQPDFNLYSWSPASDTNAVDSDFDIGDFGTTKYAADINLDDALTGRFLWFDFVAAGISAISDSGVTKIGMLITNDPENSAPTHDGDANREFSRVEMKSAETADADEDPILIVVLSLSTDVSVSAAVQTASFSLPAETVSLGAGVSPSVQTASFSLPAETVVEGLGTTVQFIMPHQNATFSIPTVTVLAIEHVTIQPLVPVAATFSTQAPTIFLGSVTITPLLPQMLTFSIPTITVSIPVIVQFIMPHQNATFSIPSPTVVEGSGNTETPAVQSASFSIPTPQIDFGVTLSPRRIVCCILVDCTAGQLGCGCSIERSDGYIFNTSPNDSSADSRVAICSKCYVFNPYCNHSGDIQCEYSSGSANTNL